MNLRVLPYKGYFDQRDARAEADTLRAGGFDVYEWQAGAFSMLGILPDPLLSHMRTYDPFALASLLIHEQTHVMLYLKGGCR